MTKRKTKKKAKPRAVMAWALVDSKSGKLEVFGYEHPTHHVLPTRAEAMKMVQYHINCGIVVRRVRIEVLA